MGALPFHATDGHGLICWPHALGVKAIPAGFARDTDFDEKYLQGDAAAGGGTGGAASHSHTTAHTHPGASHFHIVTLSGLATAATSSTYLYEFRGTRVPGTPTEHKHAAANSASADTVIGAPSAGTAASTTHPPYTKCVILKPTDAVQKVPQFGVAFSREQAAPTGFAIANGGAAAPDMDERFILGADAAGDGGAQAGSATHDHGGTVPHTQAMEDHQHGEAECGNALTAGGSPVTTVTLHAAVVVTAAVSKHHNPYLSNGGAGTSGSTSPALETVDNEPAWTKLLAIENDQASGQLETGVIVGFTGDLAALAGWSDWTLCDGNNGTPDLTTSQVKCTTTGVEVMDTGGGNAHVHELATHDHTGPNHNDHTIQGGFPFNTVDVDSGGSSTAYSGTVAHDAPHTGTVGVEGPGTAGAPAADSQSVDKRQPYRDVLWIMYQEPPRVTLAGRVEFAGRTVLAGA